MLYKNIIVTGIGALLAGASGTALAQSEPVTMEKAIAVAVDSNPEIIQAQMNKEAIEFEREQAQGRLRRGSTSRPRPASAGSRTPPGARSASPTTSSTRSRRGIRGEWTVIDFGRRRGELLRQAARVDGASLRVRRAVRIRRAAGRAPVSRRAAPAARAAPRRRTTSRSTRRWSTISEPGCEQGSISVADRQQAEERLQAALVRQDRSRAASWPTRKIDAAPR